MEMVSTVQAGELTIFKGSSHWHEYFDRELMYESRKPPSIVGPDSVVPTGSNTIAQTSDGLHVFHLLQRIFICIPRLRAAFGAA